METTIMGYWGLGIIGVIGIYGEEWKNKMETTIMGLLGFRDYWGYRDLWGRMEK